MEDQLAKEGMDTPAEWAVGELASLYPGFEVAVLRNAFDLIGTAFAEGLPGYLPLDLHYHDRHHTLQATTCLVQLLSNRHRASAEPSLSAREVLLAVVSALYHDTGYLKTDDDVDGTGAKYTHCHVDRSCAFLQNQNDPTVFSSEEVRFMQNAIRCTGPFARIPGIPFLSPQNAIAGKAVATADYLGQMAAKDYPEKLVHLHAEFAESDQFQGIPPEKRPFRSHAELLAKTPAFWRNLVLPTLENDCDGLLHFLAAPYPDGPNRHVLDTERNVRRIEEMAAAG